MYYNLCLLFNPLDFGTLSAILNVWGAEVVQGSALLQPLLSQPLLNHYQVTLYYNLVDFGRREESLGPEPEVCALLVDVANQEPLEDPRTLVDLCEAVLHMLLVHLNVARSPDLLQVFMCPQQVVGPIKLHQRVTFPLLGVLVLPDVKGVLQ